MLRRVGERREFIAAERNKDVAGLFADGAHGRAGAADFGPAIACDRNPRRPPQRDKRQTGFACRGDGIRRNHRRIGMRGIDQRVDALPAEIIGQARGTAETADANRHGMRHRRSRAAGERQRHVEAAALGEAFAEQASFRGAAENEDASHVSI